MSAEQQTAGAAELSHSELRLRQITDTIPAHVGYFDRDWMFRYGNKRYAQWFGTSSEGMKDRPILEIIGQHVFDQVESAVRRALSGEEVTYEYSMPGRGGALLHARSTLVPDFSADGEVVGCYVHAVDITEQRHTQSALAQAQKIEAIGQLTGGLAHDFNNMLTVVMGNLQGLVEVLAEHPAAAAAAADYVEPALAAAEGGAGLVRRLLAFSRQQPVAPVVVDVNALVLGMARLIRRSLPDTISIATAARDVELHALVDPGQLESALLNLAFNARDAMPNGGELRIECSLDCIEGRAAADLELSPSCYVQIAVSDNGTGMDSSILSHLFEPFFTTKKFGFGSGLGMAMVYGFIKQSGGGVRVRSRQAVGTTVSLLLPHAPRTTAAAQPVPRVPTEMVAKLLDARLVLLVEDDDKVRGVVRKQLSALGCAVLEAESGHEAADMVENIPAIALVLSDIVMPGGMDGRALARFVRRFRPELPVVLMSGYAEMSGATREDGELPMLDKPFTLERLVEVVRAAMA